jgi:hypothetical protein
MNFMNLQRISDFAENQGGRSYLFNKYSKSSEYLHAEVFAQIDSSDGIILDDLVWFAFRQNTTFTNDVCVITNSQSFSNVMVGDEHADLAVS